MITAQNVASATVGRSAAEIDAQAALAAAATSERRQMFHQLMEQAVGARYPATPVPVAIDRARFQRMKQTAEAAIRLMASPAYQSEVAGTPWFLPQHPISLDDCCGSVDFHLGENEEKITEINPMPPGFIGLLELIDTVRRKVFGASYPPVNDGFEAALADFMSDRHQHPALAIAVNHTGASRKFIPHYRYLARAMCRAGLDAKLVLAKNFKMNAHGVELKGESVRRIFSIVIFRIMEREPERFKDFIEIYRRRPEFIAPNPFVWRLGSKAILPKLWAIQDRPYGLSESDRQALKRAALPAAMLSDFQTASHLADAFGGLDTIVLKPTDDYSSRGVFIKPSREAVERLLTERPRPYVVQRFFETSTTPSFDAAGNLLPRKLTVRMGYLRDQVFGLRAATDPIASARLSSQIAPVVIV
ncbi:MAG: hypothetical protein AAGF45_00035 [Pseudomonadota bacterium]